jgi:hypothetical protein
MTSTLQVAAMASDERRFKHPPAGIVLYASAINVVRTPVMRLQLSFAAIANVLALGLSWRSKRHLNRIIDIQKRFDACCCHRQHVRDIYGHDAHTMY